MVKFTSFDLTTRNSNTCTMRPVFATIHLGHLAHNYHLLKQQAPGADVMAVVKANAYGHGLVRVAQHLARQGCGSFAVSDAQEGAALRAHLEHADIVLLSGIFNTQDAKTCARLGLTPVLHEPAQLHLLAQMGFRGKAWLKVDTGMNRIGSDDVANMMHIMRHHHIQLAGIMSHLACADTPEHPLNHAQIQRFKSMQSQYAAPAYSLMNTAGILGLVNRIDTQVVRPGIGLYGMEPLPEQALGLKPVMQLGAKVVQVRKVKKGQSVSYGATWQAKQDTWIAIVALGYGDGLPRLLSNQGHLYHTSGALPIVGRVCMDYCMLAIDPIKVKQGDEVYAFGFARGLPAASEVARQCKSISYELFCHISARVPRQYIKESL